MKILCVGHITYDITFISDNFIKENSKTRFHEKTECVGGPTTIAAFLLAKWHEDVEMAGVIGDDDYGRRIKKHCTLNHVKTNYLELNPNVETSHSVILANKENGSRTIMMYVPKGESLKPLVLNEQPDIILIDGHEYEASLELLKKYPKAISVIDAGRDRKNVVELASKVNYLVCSKEFAERVTGIKIDFSEKQTLVNAFTKMENMFKNNVVITLEAEGALYRYNGQIKIMPSIKVKTIDSTGAGDIFHGAFVYGLAQGFDYEKTLKYASIAGALSVTRVGGYKSIPTLEEMKEVYEQVK